MKMTTAREITLPLRLTAQLPMAWRHHCGALNDSAWPSNVETAVCSGCHTDIRLSEVEARYLLVETVNGG
jgi:hypothetical protein